jgi:monothiol glutaredoxin
METSTGQNMLLSQFEDVQKAIAEAVAATPILLFVKGTPEMPQCGFSKGVMDVFDDLGVEYKTVDVLSDNRIREGIKRFTNWPTIPQIFIRGQFVGGFDIVRDMYGSGELQKLVQASKH